MTSHTVSCFVDIGGNGNVLGDTHRKDKNRNLKVPDVVAPFKKSTERKNMLHDSARNLGRFCLVAVVNLVNRSIYILERKAIATSPSAESKLSFKLVWTMMALLRSEERELTIVFEVPS